MNDKYNLSSKEQDIASHIKGIMSLLGIEETPSNIDTPKRIAKMYSREVFSSEGKDLAELDAQMTTFINTDLSSMPVTMTGIKFSSMCAHHWLPFFGEVEISYTPFTKVIGLSKLPRVVKWFSKKPQTQEEMTKEIGNYLVVLLNPRNLSVKVTALHTCVACRGIESVGTETITEYRYSRGEDA